MDEAVIALLDRAEVQEVLVRYCQAIDRLDRELLATCFHEDSRHDHGYVGPSSTFLDFAMNVLGGCVATHHQLGNIAIRIEGDTAFAESYFTAYHRVGDPPPEAFADAAGMDLTIGGRYTDSLERRDGVWRITSRTGVHDWRRYEAPADRGFYDLPPGERGRRDRGDPAYRP